MVPDFEGSKEIGAIAHLYRAEVYRSTAWRQRLDITTNWAVVTTGIALSIAYSSADASPLPLVLVGLLVVVFLVFEARRYRYFNVWRFRARVLELAIFVPMLRGDGAHIPQDNGQALSDDYEKPQFRISFWTAIGRRLRRNYSWIFGIQLVAYLGKLFIHPTDLTTWSEFTSRAAIGPLPGESVLLGGLVFHLGWILVAVITRRQDRRNKKPVASVLEQADKNIGE